MGIDRYQRRPLSPSSEHEPTVAEELRALDPEWFMAKCCAELSFRAWNVLRAAAHWVEPTGGIWSCELGGRFRSLLPDVLSEAIEAAESPPHRHTEEQP